MQLCSSNHGQSSDVVASRRRDFRSWASRALPRPGKEQQIVVVRVTGPFERRWTFKSGPSGWRFVTTTTDQGSAVVELPVSRAAIWPLVSSMRAGAAPCG